MIKIICVGKIKESFFKEAIDEYLKRLTKYTKIEITEVEEYNHLPVDVCLVKEKDAIIRYINEKDYLIVLDIEGKELTSPQLANKLDEILLINSNIVFIIGGSNGLHNEIKDKSNYRLSFSRLTFPHQLFRVILLEQIYRSFKIIKNETYHK